MVLGEALTDRYGLKLKSSSHYNGYDININPGLSNAVATAVLKFLYSLTPSTYHLYDATNQYIGQKPLSSTFLDPSELYDTRKFTQYLTGLINQKVQYEDEFVTEELTSRWFGNSSFLGLDLVAHIIQQGRDHGIPGYIKWREFCGLRVVQNFDDLQDVMTQESVNRIKQVYRYEWNGILIIQL